LEKKTFVVACHGVSSETKVANITWLEVGFVCLVAVTALIRLIQGRLNFMKPPEEACAWRVKTETAS